LKLNLCPCPFGPHDNQTRSLRRDPQWLTVGIREKHDGSRLQDRRARLVSLRERRGGEKQPDDHRHREFHSIPLSLNLMFVFRDG
jgi:hypothetical protein